MLLHFPDRLVSCSRSTLAPCPRRGPSGTGGAKGFEARRGNTGTLRAVSCWGGTGCRFEVHTAGQWVGEKPRFGAETCYGYLLFGGEVWLATLLSRGISGPEVKWAEKCW